MTARPCVRPRARRQAARGVLPLVLHAAMPFCLGPPPLSQCFAVQLLLLRSPQPQPTRLSPPPPSVPPRACCAALHCRFWMVNDHIAGYRTQHATLTHLVIRNTGHMVGVVGGGTPGPVPAALPRPSPRGPRPLPHASGCMRKSLPYCRGGTSSTARPDACAPAPTTPHTLHGPSFKEPFVIIRTCRAPVRPCTAGPARQPAVRAAVPGAVGGGGGDWAALRARRRDAADGE